ncbi:PVC-type heme-binding CxxCH protein [Roseiconus lacunae]|uniref:PVC-type heme-binding CxxCH protein n=1 Tax=Roseiconus lacunae TaxID=2605694 RepID=UPI001F4073A4|nr:PVC-type heme-binding CxxCH protein [Roseiconus lacunae]
MLIETFRRPCRHICWRSTAVAVCLAGSFVLTTSAIAQTDATPPAGSEPAGSEPAGSEPAGSEPAGSEPAGSEPAGNEKVAEIFRKFKPLGAQKDESQPTPPGQMIERLKLRPGISADLVASEPEVAQPLFLSWDSRGRMWVVQYRQYQYPAGLKVVRFDQYLRAVFDKVPMPPPKGTPGEDRITVFEDSDGDGIYDQHKDVITGLNIATSVQVGPKGIWVLNPPYLLRYPDADHDDVPDGDPEVHLSGFGLQDTHSVANSLIWGPDGWLYGANGSTTAGVVSSKVTKGVNFQGQCVWRYNPKTFEFEIFAEGGGNTFSLEIDSHGEVFSGTNGGSKRGYHYPQGSYADKNWGKHGPLTNPYAFGYFTGMPMEGDRRRFAQAFAIYEGGLFPTSFDRTIIAPNSLHNLVWHSQLIPDGSTYRTADLENLIDSDDRWFRPVYSGVGPDGAIYLADWYDTRLSHVNPVDDWHKESGRIYRLRPDGAQPTYREGDLTKLSGVELVDRFNHPNKWVRRRAMLELGWRADASMLPRLHSLVDETGSLEALWAIHLSDSLETEKAAAWMEHENPWVRYWSVRLLGDRHEGHPAMVRLAKTEQDRRVQSQLASTAKRVDAATGVAIVDALSQQRSIADDRHLPLQLWWAIEAHANHPEVIQRWLESDQKIWNRPILSKTILPNLMQRYASAGTPTALADCERFVQIAPDDDAKAGLVSGLTRAFEGRSLPKLPPLLDQIVAEEQTRRGSSGVILALRRAPNEAVKPAIEQLQNSNTELGLRIELARVLGSLKESLAIDPLLKLATGRTAADPSLQRVAILSLGNFDDDRIAAGLLGSFYSRLSAEHGLRDAACRTLASRRKWAERLVNEVTSWRLKRREVPEDVIQQLRTYADDDLATAVEEAFGKPVTVSSQDKLAEIQRLNRLISERTGEVSRGEKVFAEKCGTCHRLFGQGNVIGPPLDGYERGNIKFWLNSIIEPSLEIREGYQSYQALTDDGRVLTGMVHSQDPKTVTLRTADDRQVVLVRRELERFAPMKTSLMPENLLQELTDEQIQDLFAYLMLTAY